MLDDTTSTVAEHNKIFQKHGQVWFGKFGSGFSASLIASLNQPGLSLTMGAVRSKRRPTDNQPRVFRATCSKCQKTRPRVALIPTYYRHLDLETWFCLTSELRQVTPQQIEQWLVISSEQPLGSAIASTPRPFFLVTNRAHLAEARIALGIKAAEIRYSARYGPRRLGRPRKAFRPEADFLDEDALSEEDFTDSF